MKQENQTPRVIVILLFLYALASPYDLTPPLKAIIPQLSAEWVDLVQLPFIAVGFLLLWRNRRPLRLPLWGAEFLIILGSLIAMTQAVNMLEAVETLLKDFYMFLFFIVLVNLIRDRAPLFKFIKMWQVLALVQSAIMIFAFVVTFGQPVYRPDQLAAQMGLNTDVSSQQEQKLVKREALRSLGIIAPGRQRGTMANSDLAGLYIAAAGIMMLAYPYTKSTRLKWFSFGVICFAILTTGSNGALGAFSIGLAAFFLLKSSIRERIFWLGAGATAVALLTAVLIVIPPDALAAKLADLSPIFEQGVSRLPGSVESRTAMLESGFRQWSQKPIGLSPHGMRETDAERNTHNDFGAYLYERGPLGFLGLLFLLAGSGAHAIYSGIHGDDDHRRLMAGLLGVVVVTLVNELAQEFMREREIWLTMAMIMIFADLEAKQRQAEKRAIQAVRWPWAVASTNPAVAGSN